MRILVVEDEHHLANSIKKGLELDHYAVDVAYDGSEGFDFASSEDYDLLILDIMLPGMNGLDVCRNLRKKNVHTPIILLTAKGQTEDKVVGLDSGADDYLTKPFSFEELLARIRALSRRPKKSIDSILSTGDLQLNITTFAVTRAGKSILLSGKEFALLEFFLRHPKQILTKTQIIEHVWNFDSDILPNTVEVYIRNLRRKIDLPFPHLPPTIHTIRGFGYRLGD